MPRVTRRALVRGGLALVGTGLGAGLVAGCGPIAAPWQRPKSRRIGVLATSPESSGRNLEAFKAQLRELGYVEGETIVLEVRWTEGIVARYAAASTELAALPVDVIVSALGNPGARAAKEATSTIPIVMVQSTDPVGNGLIASLNRPGGNVTGLTNAPSSLDAKRLDLLKTAAPSLGHVAVLWDPSNTSPSIKQEIDAAADALRLRVEWVAASRPDDFSPGIAGAVVAGAEGLQIVPAALFGNIANGPLVQLTTAHRLPAMSGFADFAVADGLLGYSANAADLYRRAALYVDKILKGASPAELPVELPTRFDFVVNLKTAASLGLTVPQSVLSQATEVIQ